MSYTEDVVMNTNVDSSETRRKSVESSLMRILRRNHQVRGLVTIGMLSISTILFLASCYFCWFVWLLDLWHWGFDSAGIKTPFAALSILVLAFVPLVVVVIASGILEPMWDMYAVEADARVNAKIDEAMDGQEKLELDLMRKDKSGLVKLIRYSRLQLKSYYTLGMDQNQRGFRHSTIAMWLGFAVIVAGFASYFIPNSQIQGQQSVSARDFALMSGTIIELISAAFLWMFKSSQNQLTNFYNRQFDNHNVLLLFNIAESMTDKDSAKMKIVENLLPQKVAQSEKLRKKKKHSSYQLHGATRYIQKSGI